MCMLGVAIGAILQVDRNCYTSHLSADLSVIDGRLLMFVVDMTGKPILTIA